MTVSFPRQSNGSLYCCGFALFVVLSLFEPVGASWWPWFSRRTVRVFILAGDDNVEGYASIPQLHKLTTTEESKSKYEHWLGNDKKNTWKTRDDVFVFYDHDHNSPKGAVLGKLTVGGYGTHLNHFGPELEFGYVMGEVFEEPVLIIKAGWSGRSLQKDFRPRVGDEPGGFQWFRLLANVKEATRRLSDIMGPDYANARPVISGLVWWHGYTDYDDIIATKQYRDNLAILLTFIRAKIKHKLPILVAELGGRGMEKVPRKELDFRQMQKEVTNLSRMRRTTHYVPTAQYVVNGKAADDPEPGAYYHYNGRADTMMDIGQAFGIAMAEQVKSGIRVSATGGRIVTTYSTVSKGRMVFWLALVVGAIGYVVLLIQRGNLTVDDLNRCETMFWGPSRNKKRRQRIKAQLAEEIEIEFT